MKKISKIILIIISISTILTLFCACGEPEHEHVFDQQIIEEKYLMKRVTCAEGAKYFYSCSCGEKGEEFFFDGEPLGHVFNMYIYNTDASCEKDGTETSICSRSGCFEKDTRVVPGTGYPHDYGPYVSNGDGTKTSVCRNGCGLDKTKAE